MTNKDFKKLSRTELLELLIQQTKENETLQGRIAELNGKITELETALKDRAIMIENVGSIAEASLQLNGVFEAAQRAAQEYLDSIHLRYSEQEQYAQRVEQEAKTKADQLLAQTEQRCKLLEAATSKRCDELTEKARREVEAYWAQVSAKLEEYIRQRTDLRELLSANYGKM